MCFWGVGLLDGERMGLDVGRGCWADGGDGKGVTKLWNVGVEPKAEGVEMYG